MHKGQPKSWLFFYFFMAVKDGYGNPAIKFAPGFPK